jgi:hypothetical protein
MTDDSQPGSLGAPTFDIDGSASWRKGEQAQLIRR